MQICPLGPLYSNINIGQPIRQQIGRQTWDGTAEAILFFIFLFYNYFLFILLFFVFIFICDHIWCAHKKRSAEMGNSKNGPPIYKQVPISALTAEILS